MSRPSRAAVRAPAVGPTIPLPLGGLLTKFARFRILKNSPKGQNTQPTFGKRVLKEASKHCGGSFSMMELRHARLHPLRPTAGLCDARNFAFKAHTNCALNRGEDRLRKSSLLGDMPAAQRVSRPVHSNKLASAPQTIRVPTKDLFACSPSLCRSSYSSLSRINKQPVPE